MLLGFVDSALGRNDRVREAIKHGFKIIIGDGQDIDFWCDNWTQLGELKTHFPRIFALAKMKSRPLGRWKDGRWR